MKHVQLSVDAARWPDDMLEGLGTDTATGRPLTAAEVRAELHRLKTAGYEVVPCGRCECDEKGRCTGRPLPT